MKTPLERVLRAYIDLIRQVRRIDEAKHAHRDKMLTWAIALMGGGVFATVQLRSGICSTLNTRALLWAASPWALGVLLGFLARIASASYSHIKDVFRTGETYLIRAKIATGLDDEGAKALLKELGNSPERKRHEAKAECAESITRWLYYATLGALLVGMITVFWRVTTC